MKTSCLFCDLLKQKQVPSSSHEEFYGNNGKRMRFSLCRLHACDYFKLGQDSFIKKHSNLILANRTTVPMHKEVATEMVKVILHGRDTRLEDKSFLGLMEA